MADVLLVLRAGRADLRYALYGGPDVRRPFASGEFSGMQTRPRFTARVCAHLDTEREWPVGTSLTHEDALHYLLSIGLRAVLTGHTLVGVGHRIEHGGRQFTRPMVVTAEVLDQLERLTPFASLEHRQTLAPMKAVSRLAPGIPQVACFETAFHSTQDVVAQTYGLPHRLTEQGLIAYGFHGLSCENVALQLAAIDPRAATGRIIVAHLDYNSSLTALHGGRSVATTTGFGEGSGLVTAQACGAVDAGVLFYLLEQVKMSPLELRHLLQQESGLLGMSGLSSDLRVLLRSADRRATAACDTYLYRIRREAGSLVAALGGLDGLVFTGVIGYGEAVVRSRVCQELAWLGVEIDERDNAAGDPRITDGRGRVRVWVIAPDDEGVIARHTWHLLEPGRPTAGTT